MLGLKNPAILQGCFNYIFVHLRQKVRFRPEISPKILSTLGPNPTRKARLDFQSVPTGTLDFCHTQVHLDIFNRSNFKNSTFSGLKADSAEENRIKKKK